ncbi:MAG: hypothetical protein ACD_19C00176G0028 [uncultured bacterium]|nr:MAG: hypothetical protein ACD_19C00176G0028 [uncultured bacterium]
MTKKINFEKKTIKKICEENDIKYLGLFGSYARNEANQKSDVDLLVSFIKSKGFFELVQIENKFSKAFNVKVDLVTKNALNVYLKPYVNKDLKTLYNVNTR